MFWLPGALKLRIFPGAFGRGNSKLAILRAGCEISDAGMTLFGKGEPVVGSMGLFLLCEKSPATSSAEGIGPADPGLDCTLRSDSQEKNRKLLSRFIGPPRLAPNWFCLRGFLGRKVPPKKNWCASRSSFLR